MTAKKLMGQFHLWLGLASGLVVVIVTLTGCLLVFDKELDEAVNHDFYFVKVPLNAQRLPMDNIMQSAAAVDPSYKISRMGIETAATDRSVLFFARKEKQILYIAVNPYTGKVIEAFDYNTRFFTVVLRLHRTLCMDEVGKAITGVSCIIFLIMIITGLVLWWPKRWKMLKQRLSVKWSASRKRLNWDLHAVGGFYMHLVLFAIALTGLTWAYKWFNNGIFLVFDGKPYKKFEVPLNKVQQPIAAGFYEGLYQQANQRLPYKGELSFIINEKDSFAITVNKENHEASMSNVVDALFYERGTGRLLQDRLYKNESTGWKARRIVYPIHTGQLYGLPTKIIAFVACLIGVSLPITGVYIWLGRKKKTAKAKKKKPLPVAAEQAGVAVVV